MEVITNTQRTGVISEKELRAAAGNADEATVLEILDLQPTIAELEQAVVWASSDGDVFGKSGHQPRVGQRSGNMPPFPATVSTQENLGGIGAGSAPKPALKDSETGFPFT